MKFSSTKGQLIRVLITLILLMLVGLNSTFAQRSKISFNQNWRFSLSADASAIAPDYNDAGWRQLDVPHDWSIEGTFSDKNPATVGGGALPGGIGWYRKSFATPANISNKLLYIEFDGVYRNSEVWINGHYLGKRPYGYSSFRYEITNYLKHGSAKQNILVVKVDNSIQPNSRWYSGSGIYRNVWLITTSPIAVDHWGTYITTPVVDRAKATVTVQTRILNHKGKPQVVSVVTAIYDKMNRVVAKHQVNGLKISDSAGFCEQNLTVINPVLWSIEKPYLYRTVTKILSANQLTDTYETNIGIRHFEFDVDKGFILNDKPVKILGVCNHHDLGCLGAAINSRAIERQLEILKSMGCNAIRTSHNPPAPELLDLCDRMGFIVMDEAFDMWKMKKTDFDYSHDFDEWHKRDLTDMLLRDRNHPCVFLWSIGNEIPEQRDITGGPIATELAAIVKSIDPTRPVTAANDHTSTENFIIKSGALGVVGFNYHHKEYEAFQKNFPGMKFISSESTSALATRGSYDMPSDSIRRWPLRWDIPFTQGNADLTCSSYDNCSAPWGSTHEETWRVVKRNPFISGLFIWTGFDYLGEPTPYPWPAHSSYFGINDLCGFPKDAFYFYKSEWTSTPTLHIFPHWNWKPGEVIDVWAYTNCDQVELLLNGVSLGKQKKTSEMLHLSWTVPFEAGTLTAVGWKDGKEIARDVVKTAGEPAKLKLIADRTTIKADGSDLSFVTVQIVDKNGVIVPQTDNDVKFEVQGPASIAGVDSGNPVSLESFKADHRKAFHGLGLLVVKAGRKAAPVQIIATSPGLEHASLTIYTK